MSGQNKEVVRAFSEDVFTKHQVDRAREHLAADVVEHDPFPGYPPTVDGFVEGAKAFLAAFPDLRCEIDDLIAEGDQVVLRSRLIGTHRGELMGIPPTNRTVEVKGIDIVRLTDGKIVEHWGVFDAVGMMTQLGVMPGPPTE